MDGKPNRRNKAAFANFSSACGRLRLKRASGDVTKARKKERRPRSVKRKLFWYLKTLPNS